MLIGWAAVTGSLAPAAWGLFAVVFFWQMPHFYPLAMKYKDDYARAGIPMLPVVASTRRVNAEILIFAWLTVLTSLAALAARAQRDLRRADPGGGRHLRGRGAPALPARDAGRGGQADAAVPLVDDVPDDRLRRRRARRADLTRVASTPLGFAPVRAGTASGDDHRMDELSV